MAENVLLITVDSLRYDTWCDMRSSLRAAPEIESEGISFEQAYATGPGTTSSFPGMLTGTLPLSHGGLGPLNQSRPRVASELRRRGLLTGGFHSNPFLSTHFDYDVGFDEFADYQNPLMGVATRIFPRGIEINNPKLKKIDDVLNLTRLVKSAYRRVSGKSRPYVSAEVITDDTIAWLEDIGRPFFGWAHYMDVHHPCHPPREDRAAYGVEHVDNQTVSDWYSALIRNPESLTDDDISDMLGLYRAAVHYVDRQIYRLLNALERSGAYEDTLVVLTSDHGELFGECGQYGKPERMYDELLRVPLVIVNSPPSVDITEDEMVSLLDLPPLFHAALDVDVPSAYEGVVPENGDREYVVAEHEVDDDPIVGVRSDRWLYEADDIAGERRLFDLQSGTPVEVDTIVEDEEAATVRQVGENRLRDVQLNGRVRHEDDLTQDVEERLGDLGYR
jgi:arylsulfatase A-like enzyme